MPDKNQTEKPLSNGEAVMALWDREVPFFIRKISAPGSDPAVLMAKVSLELTKECQGIIDRPASCIVKGLPYHTYGGNWKHASGFLIGPTVQPSALYKMQCNSVRKHDDSMTYDDIGGKPYKGLLDFINKLREEKDRLITKELPELSTKQIADQFIKKHPRRFNSEQARNEALSHFLKTLIKSGDEEIIRRTQQQIITKYNMATLHARKIKNVDPKRILRERRFRWDKAYSNDNQLPSNEALLKVRSLPHRKELRAEDCYNANQATQQEIDLQLQLANSHGDIVGVYFNPESREDAYILWKALSEQQGESAPVFTYHPDQGLVLIPSDTVELMFAIAGAKHSEIAKIIQKTSPEKILQFMGIEYQNGIVSLKDSNVVGKTSTASFWFPLYKASPDFVKQILTTKNPDGSTLLQLVAGQKHNDKLLSLLHLFEFMMPDQVEALFDADCAENSLLYAAAVNNSFMNLEHILIRLEKCSPALISKTLGLRDKNGRTVLYHAMHNAMEISALLNVLQKCAPEDIWKLFCENEGDSGFSSLLDCLIRYGLYNVNNYMERTLKSILLVLAQAHPDFLARATDTKDSNGLPVKPIFARFFSKEFIGRFRDCVISATAHAYAHHGNALPDSTKRNIKSLLNDDKCSSLFLSELLVNNQNAFYELVNTELEREKVEKKKTFFKRSRWFSKSVVYSFFRANEFTLLIKNEPEKFILLAKNMQNIAPESMGDFMKAIFDDASRVCLESEALPESSLLKELYAVNPKVFASSLSARIKAFTPASEMIEKIIYGEDSASQDRILTKKDLQLLLEFARAAEAPPNTMFSRVFHRAKSVGPFSKHLILLIKNMGDLEETTPEQCRFLNVMVDLFSSPEGFSPHSAFNKTSAVREIIMQSKNLSQPGWFIPFEEKMAQFYSDYPIYCKIMQKPIGDLDAVAKYIHRQLPEKTYEEIRTYLQVEHGLVKSGCFPSRGRYSRI